MFRSPVKIETLHFRNGPCYWPNKLSIHPRWDQPFPHSKHQSQFPTSNTPNHTIHSTATVSNQGVGLGSRITGKKSYGDEPASWGCRSKMNDYSKITSFKTCYVFIQRKSPNKFNPHGHGSGLGILWTFIYHDGILGDGRSPQPSVDPTSAESGPSSLNSSRHSTAKTGPEMGGHDLHAY